MSVKSHRRQRIVFVGDLQVHSIREACQGAAEYCGGRSDLDFDPWPVRYDDPDTIRRLKPEPSDGILASGAATTALLAERVPWLARCVFFLSNGESPATPGVELDEPAIGRMAAEHLLQRGYRHLAFFGSASKRWSALRAQGFEAAARRAGIAVTCHELPLRTLPIYWSYRRARPSSELAWLIDGLPKPCGILAANDVIACFAIEAARDGGLRVPHQVGVIGVDDDPVPNAAAGLAITSVQAPFREV
ncbi:MAG: substrate-binding domain-containing protein, partial [Kiritimatiellae bacterium]|nr:substrate-binding domain-containing protein [Kiritimatiellia bacterium]